MSSRIFITGVTGYVGGHQVSLFQKQHQDYRLVALVRSASQAALIKAAFPAVETVIGDLDNDEVLQVEASQADVVLNFASSDHVAGAISIIKGIAKGGKDGKFFHISGTGILTDMSTGAGNEAPKVYHDMSSKDISEILSFDSSHIHRETEEAIVAAAKDNGVKVAIISPPMIHGIGDGPIKRKSLQVPVLIEQTLKRGKGFQILEGNNVQNAIHVDDLASAIAFLTEGALKGEESKAVYIPEGYYFVETEEFRWGDISRAVAQIAHNRGLIGTDAIDKLSVEQATSLHPWGAILWGGNCRGSAERLKALGWETSGKRIANSLDAMVEFEVNAGERQR